MNPLTVNPAIVLDQALRLTPQRTVRRTRRSGRAVHAARTARVALERAGL
ncbi:hypothetical protein [Nocardioides sp. URHA0020]|nr:hypothetical protein [Nocardioides sp. URHA0020]